MTEKLITKDGWQKSTRSGAQEGNCVEVAELRVNDKNV